MILNIGYSLDIESKLYLVVSSGFAFVVDSDSYSDGELMVKCFEFWRSDVDRNLDVYKARCFCQDFFQHFE